MVGGMQGDWQAEVWPCAGGRRPVWLSRWDKESHRLAMWCWSKLQFFSSAWRRLSMRSENWDRSTVDQSRLLTILKLSFSESMLEGQSLGRPRGMLGAAGRDICWEGR